MSWGTRREGREVDIVCMYSGEVYNRIVRSSRTSGYCSLISELRMLALYLFI